MSDMKDHIGQLNQTVASLYQHRQLGQALPLAREACREALQFLGEDEPETAGSLGNLGLVLQATGDLAGARPYLERALAVLCRVFGQNDPDTAGAMNNLGMLLKDGGDLAGARQYLEQALAVWRRVLGAEDVTTSVGLNNLGLLCHALGELPVARTYHEQALAVRRHHLGENDLLTAQSHNNLGSVLKAMGDLDGARQHYVEALHVFVRLLGRDNALTAGAFNNLGMLLQEAGDRTGARSLLEQALAIRVAILGKDHPDTGRTLNNLGLLLHLSGDLVAARPLLQQALDVRRQSLGEDHPDTAQGLNNLGVLLNDAGEPGAARALLEQALEARRRVLGDDHLETAVTLANLAGVCARLGEPEAALELKLQGVAIEDRAIGHLFAAGSDRQRAAFSRTTHGSRDSLLSLVWRYFAQAPDRIGTALDLVLRRKGIVAEAQAVQRDAVLSGAHPHMRERLREWSDLRLQLARRTLAGPGAEDAQTYRQQLIAWNSELERLETDLARQVPEMNLEPRLRAANCKTVAGALPPGSCLVELIRFLPLDFAAVPGRGEWRWQPARYLAFVLPARQPDDARLIDLGEARQIDVLVDLFHSSIARPSNDRPDRNMGRRRLESVSLLGDDPGDLLRSLVFDPLLPALGDLRSLLLSPDGNLTRLPFALLSTPDGKLLMDSFRISYVNTGRDVLRFEAASSGRPSPPLVICDPDFDLVGTAKSAAPSALRRSRDLEAGCLHFGRLPATQAEGESIGALLGVEPWQQREALESRLKEHCRSPRILHLATHGFFLEDSPNDPSTIAHALGLYSGNPGRLAGPLPENPLLRSGLALAGANTFLKGGTPPDEAEDGLLTAEDVSGLDLLATELVVLSACETGLGEVKTGEGVFGLQRAFTLAGARTLVMSLWSVPDEQTRELMEDFYRRLLAGEGKADALRNAQLSLRKKYPDPYFWGAFICQGDPGPLSTR
jgi:CHAT domain-containing protein/tetratricopeptide (TPR) repeat protein